MQSTISKAKQIGATDPASRIKRRIIRPLPGLGCEAKFKVVCLLEKLSTTSAMKASGLLNNYEAKNTTGLARGNCRRCRFFDAVEAIGCQIPQHLTNAA